VRTDGTVAWIELLGRVCADDEGRPNIVRGVGFDVTERQTYLEELTGRKAVLRRLIEVQENERQTLCHDLHDGMMQHAIGAKMLLESIVNVAGSAEQGERIDAALDFLNRGIEEGRRLIRGVRSAVLDDLGLVAAIQDLSDQIATHGIAVDMALDDGLDDLPPTLQTTVYRVVQESLTNVRKHAETDRTAVEICRTPADVVVRVSDSGRGFDVDDGRRRGFGLVGMTERVRLIGGSCTIESRLGSGSRVEARLPVSQIEAAGVSSPSDFQLTRS
jgi:signal transduction histidine kinase